MRVISVPSRLKWALCAMAVCVPLAALETAIVARAPYWKLPLRSMAMWSLLAVGLDLGLTILLARASRWALPSVGAAGFLWSALSAWYAFRFRHYGVAFFTLFLSLFWFMIYGWLSAELGRSFFDPWMRWFHGLPRAIPGLTCKLEFGSLVADFRVCRIDDDGAFLFVPSPRFIGKLEPFKASRSKAKLKFTYRGEEIDCLGNPVAELDNQAGLGFQFSGMTPDAKKQLGDFVESLRGEGHL